MGLKGEMIMRLGNRNLVHPIAILLVPAMAMLVSPVGRANEAPSARAGSLSMADFLDAPSALDDGDASDVLDGALVEALVASRDGQRLALSTLLCEARQYRDAIQDRLLLKVTSSLKAEARRVDSRIVRAKAKLDILGLAPMGCDDVLVTRLMGCRELVPPSECESDEELATQTRAVGQVEIILEGSVKS
jgi:hypothetical protein